MNALFSFIFALIAQQRNEACERAADGLRHAVSEWASESWLLSRLYETPALWACFDLEEIGIDDPEFSLRHRLRNWRFYTMAGAFEEAWDLHIRGAEIGTAPEDFCRDKTPVSSMSWRFKLTPASNDRKGKVTVRKGSNWKWRNSGKKVRTLRSHRLG